MTKILSNLILQPKCVSNDCSYLRIYREIANCNDCNHSRYEYFLPEGTSTFKSDQTEEVEGILTQVIISGNVKSFLNKYLVLTGIIYCVVLLSNIDT